MAEVEPASTTGVPAETAEVSQETRPGWAELTVSVLLIIGAAAFWNAGREYDETARQWPSILSIGLLILGVIDLVRGLWQRRNAPSQVDQNERNPYAGLRDQMVVGLIILVFAVLSYGFGYLVATLVTLPAYVALTKRKYTGLSIVVAIGLCLFMEWLFGRVLNVSLHVGQWGGIPDAWLPY